mmetsp:Transcript_51487/g.85317  ORF Transcript_51487/g.85317 Transcript_51487/m.85317 type:complete len:157 (-) Transcript_51487:143-613(-)|eukprot:CAMPEP_0202695050 /NCGR_PEP_ID=MMETSP1385-20130828/8744_1 /ASSEMBLY_ACC=CAM_ASM_000861 /TAXON_ID=933848 /ORGANISM="Elphidium margaritaceum" /LENGTH=156 /DNA_ID=CAMNT_0049351011 /DNA_START=44 /DNA_END=514 /DNA_ORIENTATION=-
MSRTTVSCATPKDHHLPAITVDTDDEKVEVHKEGWLSRESKFLKKLKKSYVVLTRDCLYSFHSKPVDIDAAVKGKDKQCVPEDKYELPIFKTVTISEGKHCHHAHQFEITSLKSKVIFVGSSCFDMEEWVLKVQCVQRWIATGGQQAKLSGDFQSL